MPMEDSLDLENAPQNKVDGPPTRYEPPKFVVGIAPDGSVVKLHIDNARDWQSRPGHRVNGTWKDEVVADEVATSADAPTEDNVVEGSERKPAAEVLEPLEILRREASALGIKVHPQWGKKRLTAEIKSARDAMDNAE